MKIERSVYGDVDVQTAFDTCCNKDYQIRKCIDSGAVSYSVQITGGVNGPDPVVRVRRKLPTTGFPGVLRKFVPSTVTMTETIRWGAMATDGSRTADLDVEFHGAPARMKGTIQIVPEGENGSTVAVSADFRARVPLLGHKIERAAAPVILSVIDSEEKTSKSWIAGVH